MRRDVKFLGFLFLLFVISIPGHTQQKTYIATESNLYEINLETCSAREVPNHHNRFLDNAYCPSSGKLYGILEKYIFEIDTIKKMLHFVMETIEVNALTCDNNGLLYSADVGYIQT